jgi:hypothetical protein
MTVVERERVQTEVTVRDVLHRAVDLLEEFGWCQGENEVRDNRPFCVGTAIQRAVIDYGIDWTDVEPHEWNAYLHSAWDACRFDRDMVQWNDTPGRTKAEVVARLRAAAEAA